MKILVAPDKFKGSLSAPAAAEAMARGLRDVAGQILVQPIADGGEGTCELIGESVGARRITQLVSDPFGRPVAASFYFRDEVAYLDASQAAGLWRLTPAERNPVLATSFGLGEQMRAAQEMGARRLVIGLGGTATCDGGVGMAAALGALFLTENGALIQTRPADFFSLARIIPLAHALPEIVVACDVVNPLLGASGAAKIFAPQKGASPAQVEYLERALVHLCEVVNRDLNTDFRETPGAGAAGGLGYGLMSFCGGKICSGFEIVATATGLEAALQECDLVLTGEGSLDAQTLSGKGPAGVAALARKWGKPVVAFGGRVQPELERAGVFDHVIGINPVARPPAESMQCAAELLTRAVARFCTSSVFRAWSCSDL